MKLLFILCILNVPFEQDSIKMHEGVLLYQNLLHEELYFPKDLTTSAFSYNFRDSLFVNYETLKDLKPINELHGDLYDFFYYNFDIINSRYNIKNYFENKPPENFIWNSTQTNEPREPCDSIIFMLTDDLLYTWFPCFTGPFKIGNHTYVDYKDYLEKQKKKTRIYDLGNIKIKKDFESRLILIDWNDLGSYQRDIYLFNTSSNRRIRSIANISQYKVYDQIPTYVNTQLNERGLFYIKFDYPTYYREKENQAGYWLDDPWETYFCIDKKGFIVFPEVLNK